MKEVQVYRLWPNGTWDLVAIEVEADPWVAEIIESRAVTRAWQLLSLTNSAKPMQIGLYMPSFQPAVIP